MKHWPISIIFGMWH